MFLEMKGIVGESREMKIPLKPNVKPVKKIPYRMNPTYNKKVKLVIDKMLEAGIIELVEELEWIRTMVFEDKKTGESRSV
jgi:hypothetical protein